VTVLEGLERDGYAIVEGVFDPGPVKAALGPILDATPHGRNDFEGFDTRRAYGLLAKTRALDDLILHPLVLDAAEAILGDHWLSALVAIQIGPGESAQDPHHDDGIYPLPWPHQDVILNTMWAVDDFTRENGATFLYPGSHRWEARVVPDGAERVHAEMPAGSVLLYPGTLIHGGGANTTGATRLGVLIELLASWLRQQEQHTLVVPAHEAGGIPKRLTELMGYSIRPPFVGYVDGLHPQRLIAR
jgi:ectoine hydroxylase-related dioxygenase (phytanoyl-CoA dioxygenase family)